MTRRVAVAIFAAINLVVFWLRPALADTATNVATLNDAEMSVVFDGSHIYMFGGWSSFIRRFDPSSSTFSTMSAKLPKSQIHLSAVWTGQNILVFGGASSNKVTRYDPASGTITVLNASISNYDAAAWTGTYAFVFGGQTITRYDPSTDVATVMNARLPSTRNGMAAVYDGYHIYLIGGDNGTSTFSDILRYDPSADTISLVNSLPTARTHVGAAFDGKDIYIFGGIEELPYSTDYGFYDGYASGQILRYQSFSNWVDYMSTYLDPGRGGIGTVWNGSTFNLLGGYYWESEQYADYGWEQKKKAVGQTLRYTIAPGPPRNVGARPGANLGQTLISWDPPLYNTFSPNSPITSFRVYRNRLVAGGGYQLIADTYGYYTTYIDYGCPLLEICNYKVSAVNDRGEGTLSSAVSSPGTYYSPGY